MIKQSQIDRADRIYIEEKLKEMTKDRDNYKEKFLVTYEQLSESENKLIDLRYDYDEQIVLYNSFWEKHNRMSMQLEDYRSKLMNYSARFKELKKKEQELIELEKELRKIKKRSNPFEYSDFADKHTQTHNPVKEKGWSTDELLIEYNQKHRSYAKSNLRSSFADTVTTVLGGIPAGTETITEIDLVSPKESSKLNKIYPIHLKTRPQSSQFMGGTYSYNIKNGIIEEENNSIGFDPFSTRSKDPFTSTSSIAFNNFGSPSALRPTALQRHQKASKWQFDGTLKEESDYSNVFEQRVKTALSIQKERYIKKPTQVTMKSVYIHGISDNKTRPMTEQPGMRRTKNTTLSRRDELIKNATNSRPASQDPTMSKTQISTKIYVGRSKTSLRNLIKAASTRNGT